jgi:hypothetical protein
MPFTTEEAAESLNCETLMRYFVTSILVILSLFPHIDSV